MANPASATQVRGGRAIALTANAEFGLAPFKASSGLLAAGSASELRGSELMALEVFELSSEILCKSDETVYGLVARSR